MIYNVQTVLNQLNPETKSVAFETHSWPYAISWSAPPTPFFHDKINKRNTDEMARTCILFTKDFFEGGDLLASHLYYCGWLEPFTQRRVRKSNVEGMLIELFNAARTARAALIRAVLLPGVSNNSDNFAGSPQFHSKYDIYYCFQER